ncbi:hypothetical protein BJX68DRAFT_35581 [Aspergillus pseudodeflectus]|uniref:Uncharacterized protein n=1 Tax=Aspergillus pseudodeflectus TaxID=176178 RepID=A0ABR4J982_9EURO
MKHSGSGRIIYQGLLQVCTSICSANGIGDYLFVPHSGIGMYCLLLSGILMSLLREYRTYVIPCILHIIYRLCAV